MSHFSVLVIGDRVDEKLAPYDENLEMPEYDTPCSCRGQKARHATAIQAAQETLQSLGEPVAEDPVEELRTYSHSHATDEAWEKYRELAGKLMAVHSGKDAPDPNCEDCHGSGVAKSTHNPKSKWDWYEAGGRFHGKFVLKNGCSTEVIAGKGEVRAGGPSWGWKAKDIATAILEKRVSQAKFGEIDWDKAQRVSEESLVELNNLWDWVEGKITDEDAEKKHVFPFYKKSYYLDRYGTREENIRRDGLFGTYAVVTEQGEWIGQGDMGWWGMSTETHDDATRWANEFWDRFLKNLSPDTLLTVVDCHI